MKYTALDVAAAFIRLGSEDRNSLTNMQVQKLTYIANGYYLAIFGKQLFGDEIRAWQYGPVIPDLYDKLRKYRNNTIDTPPSGAKPIAKDSDADLLIRQVYKVYGKMLGWQLSNLTHQANTPWSNTWNVKKFGAISADEIRSHYRELLERSRVKRNAAAATN